jgi:hypothetical protein
MPWITEITFEEFLFREYLKKKNWLIILFP